MKDFFCKPICFVNLISCLTCTYNRRALVIVSTYGRWQHHRLQVQVRTNTVTVRTRRHVGSNRLLLGDLCNEMTELHQAAAAGDFDRVEEILRQNKCNPNQRDIDWSYKTPLHWAAAKGSRRNGGK